MFMKRLVLAIATVSVACQSTETVVDADDAVLDGSETDEEVVSDEEFYPLHNYQIGDEWGRTPVSLPTKSRAARATIRVGSGTGFLLGEFFGELVVATNNHALSRNDDCSVLDTSFPAIRVKAQCTRIVGTWPEIDFTLFTVDVAEKDRAIVREAASNFDYASELTPGRLLSSVGFGIAGNSGQVLKSISDADCRVFSSEIRQIDDPDHLRPGPYRVWSFAHGCETSHGDSGSAIVDRQTERPLGIVWTAKSPKDQKTRDSLHLKTVQTKQSPEIWSELAYAVPASKIREVIKADLDQGKIRTQDRGLLRAIIVDR